MATKSGKTGVWNHFEKDANAKVGKCKFCKKVIKCDGGSTSSLWKHLRGLHADKIKQSALEICAKESSTEEEQDGGENLDELFPKKKAKKTIIDFFEKQDNIETAISHLAAVDGKFHNLFFYV